MTWLRRRWWPLTVLVAASALLVGSAVWAAGRGAGPASPLIGGPAGMMGGGPGVAVVPGTGPVGDLDGAARAARSFGDSWGLSVGEVMQFDNGFYAELVDSSGNRATEVLVDPRTGAVQVEFGPAMMWNTTYGMHRWAGGRDTVTPDQAQAIADRWLAANRPGEHAGEAELFPGYYTLDTLRGDATAGMLSVNATTGAVWYHTWHGRFIASKEY